MFDSTPVCVWRGEMHGLTLRGPGIYLLVSSQAALQRASAGWSPRPLSHSTLSAKTLAACRMLASPLCKLQIVSWSLMLSYFYSCSLTLPVFTSQFPFTSPSLNSWPRSSFTLQPDTPRPASRPLNVFRSGWKPKAINTLINRWW